MTTVRHTFPLCTWSDQAIDPPGQHTPRPFSGFGLTAYRQTTPQLTRKHPMHTTTKFSKRKHQRAELNCNAMKACQVCANCPKVQLSFVATGSPDVRHLPLGKIWSVKKPFAKRGMAWLDQTAKHNKRAGQQQALLHLFICRCHSSHELLNTFLEQTKTKCKNAC